MPNDGTAGNPALPALLGEDEPAPFVVRNAASSKPILLVCDHASRRFPMALGTMGLDPVARRCHLALDIGVAALTESLAASLGVTAVLCQYSRLVVDCNRQLMDPGAFLEFGDGVVIPGNRNLTQADKDQRAEAIYWPYHRAIDAQIQRFQSLDIEPVFVSLHSFTPVLNGVTRPWEMGVLSDKDRVTADIFVHDLREAGYHVGDNEPYSGKALQDFTIDHHAESIGIPHVGVEVRQDLIHLDDGVAKVAAVMRRLIDSVPARIRPTPIGKKKPTGTAS